MSKLRDVLASLSEIKGLAEKATPGPLVIVEAKSDEECGLGAGLYVSDADGTPVLFASSGRQADAMFFSKARQDVPDLAEALKEARELLEQACDVLTQAELRKLTQAELRKTIREVLGK